MWSWYEIIHILYRNTKYELFHINFTSFHCTGRYELNKLASLPMCGFIAQLVKHRTGIAEVTRSNPVEVLIIFRLLSNCFNWKIYCDDHSSLWTGTSFQWRLMWGNIIKKRLRSYSRYWTGTSLQWRLMRGNIIKKRLMSYSRYWTGTSLQWRLMRGNIIKKRLMSYSRYWTGTSLQWRLMRGNIIKKRLMSYSWYWTGTSLQWRLMRREYHEKEINVIFSILDWN